MIFLIDFAIILALIRLIIEYPRPKLMAGVFAGSRVIFIPISAYQHPSIVLLFLVPFAFGFVYFWLLCRLDQGSLGWWLVLLALPTLRVLAMLSPALAYAA